MFKDMSCLSSLKNIVTEEANIHVDRSRGQDADPPWNAGKRKPYTATNPSYHRGLCKY